jgi:UDP-N-acetylmuramate dehydrogenase
MGAAASVEDVTDSPSAASPAPPSGVGDVTFSEPTRLADLTTLRVGGPAARLVLATASDEAIDAVTETDAAGRPLLVIGGGSNLVVGDAGFDGTVLRMATRGIVVESEDPDGQVTVRVAAGETWDDFVAVAVERGWSGVEALSGIPGSVGACPMQNVGAYGQEISGALDRIRVWDRQDSRVSVLSNADCEFGYRTSRLKQDTLGGAPRFIVLESTFRLRRSATSAPIRYAELARHLGVEVGERASSAATREAVLALRAGKGMVVDPADHDSWSTGSFFTNPVLSAEEAAQLPQEAPRWPMPGGRVKTSAAWLIEGAGFSRGYGLPGPVCLSTKHTLAITNRGTATAEDVLAMARELRDGVRKRFGVTLNVEPVLVNCSL